MHGVAALRQSGPVWADACVLSRRARHFAAVAAAPAGAVTILPTFDSTITSSSHASTIETAINNALTFYANFVNPLTVNIDFQLAPSGATYLGGSQSTYYFDSYSNYTSALLANATGAGNQTELVAYNHLGTGNTADLILATSADFRALGTPARRASIPPMALSTSAARSMASSI